MKRKLKIFSVPSKAVLHMNIKNLNIYGKIACFLRLCHVISIPSMYYVYSAINWSLHTCIYKYFHRDRVRVLYVSPIFLAPFSVVFFLLPFFR